MRSKKQYVARLAAPPDSQFVFFLSRCLGSDDVRSALIAAGVTVEIHNDHFSPNETDDVWLTEVGRRGWVVITRDERIRYRMVEKQAIARAKVRTFFLVPRGLSGPENGAVLVKALARMTRFCIGNQPPFIAKVFRNGTVKMWERPKNYAMVSSPTPPP